KTEKSQRVTIRKLQEHARAGEKLVMLTCYDASFARLSDEAGVDMLLIGDSLGMVIQGKDDTLSVKVEDTEYHVRCVARGSERVQGKEEAAADQLVADAKALEEAGAAIVLMEAMPAAVARRVTESISVPTIGIGAGPHVSGQVLVNYDILDIYPGRKARFV